MSSADSTGSSPMSSCASMRASVGGILQQGGTVLGSSRCPEFKDEEFRRLALSRLGEHGIEGLVVIGGNGSQRGASALSSPGVPGRRRRLDDRQRPLRQRHHDRRRHRAQHRARGDRPPQDHRLLAPPGFPGRGHGARLRLSRPDGGDRRRRRGGAHPGGADRPGGPGGRAARRLRAGEAPRPGRGGGGVRHGRPGLEAALRRAP